MASLDKISVIGAGVLGGQISWHSAFKGKAVTVHDIANEAIDRCMAAYDEYAAIYRTEYRASVQDVVSTRSRLTYSTDLAEAVADADLVIEAVPEVASVKTALYVELARLLKPHTLIATNSSTFLPGDFADATGRPAQFCALHFAVRIWTMNYAEVMAHRTTARETLARITEFAVDIGMVPIAVRKEHNGYVANGWVLPLLNAAQTLVTNGVATPEDVDRTYLLTGATVGPFGMMDMIGMQTCYDVLRFWGDRNADVQMGANADYLKRNLLDRGLLGMQTGEGFYTYPDPAYGQPHFLAVPGKATVPEFVDRIMASSATAVASDIAIR